MKNRLLVFVIVGLLLCSSLLVVSAKDICPTCDGEKTIACTKCDGTGEISTGTDGGECEYCSGTGTMTPQVTLKTGTVDQRDGITFATGTFVNKETVDVTGVVTAELDGHTNSSEEMTFPPDEEITVTVGIDYLGSYSSTLQLMQHLKMSVTGIEDMSCPYCDGSGTASGTTTCTKCDGIGTIDCPKCDGTGYVVEGLAAETAFPWAAVQAVVAVVVVVGVGIVAFIVFKKRRVSERSLRRRSARDFNDWVLKRLDGKVAGSGNALMNIDGYSASGAPVLIKQADNVGMSVIDGFAAALARSKARSGVVVAFSYGGDAVRGKVRAQMNYKLQIEMLTVQELIDSKRTV